MFFDWGGLQNMGLRKPYALALGQMIQYIKLRPRPQIRRHGPETGSSSKTCLDRAAAIGENQNRD
jgi:hypothetical protein